MGTPRVVRQQTGVTPIEQPCIVGIDVSVATLDVRLEPAGAGWQVPNTDAGIATLIVRLSEQAPTMVVVEATGGLERRVLRELDEAGLPWRRANPWQVRQFARAMGQLHKTDQDDARLLAQYGASLHPRVRSLPSPLLERVKAVLARRRQLVKLRVMERNRRQRIAPQDDLVAASIVTVLTVLDEQIAALEQAMRHLLSSDEACRGGYCLLQEVPGVGPILASTLLADLPELAEASSREVAAIVGVAPYAWDSGAWRGQRHIWGGRASVRHTLYQGTLAAKTHNPVIRCYYERLVAAGKPHKVAMVACMRKLLTILGAMLRSGTHWHPDLALKA